MRSVTAACCLIESRVKSSSTLLALTASVNASSFTDFLSTLPNPASKAAIKPASTSESKFTIPTFTASINASKIAFRTTASFMISSIPIPPFSSRSKGLLINLSVNPPHGLFSLHPTFTLRKISTITCIFSSSVP